MGTNINIIIMSGRPQSQPGLMAERERIADDGEALHTRTRQVQNQAEFTLSHTIPSEARDLLGLGKGDTVRIEIFRDGYYVTVDNSEDNGSE